MWSLAFSMAACDFLDTEPFDTMAPETFYQNKQECEQALAGVYSTLALQETYGNNYSLMLSNTDDLSYFAREAGSRPIVTHGAVCNTHDESDEKIFEVWKAFYDGINNSNVLLDNIDKAKFDDEKERTRIKGEAKFLRAYYHFILVQGWYEVPIRKITVKNIETSSMEATPHAEALDWIIGEMEACINMVEPDKFDNNPARIKKTVVEGILARVYLWRAGAIGKGGKPFYELAAKHAKNVYSSQKHQLNRDEDITTIWQLMAGDGREAAKNESMWEAEFIGNRDNGNNTNGRIGNEIGILHAATPDNKATGAAFYCSTLILYDLFDKNDRNDKRRTLSIAEYKRNNKGAQALYKYNASDISKTEFVERPCAKFRREWEKVTPQNANWTPENFPILRYADVLLMWSEAELESTGNVTEALIGINEVRNRAGIAKLEDNISPDKLRQEIRDERARELCFEALRKYDLIRWGIYVDAIKNKLGTALQDPRWQQASKKQYKTGVKQFVDYTQDKHQFLPIPIKELSVNTKLEQNKFWK